jgi:predicted ATP-grasp superfamily ATP-dependent carboligase
VLVTDGEQRCALAACRALAAAGCEVAVASAHGPAAAKWSRYCSERIRVPDPRRDPASFADGLRRHLTRKHYDVVIAGGDASLLALSAQRRLLEPLTRLGLPPHEVLVSCLDKAVLDAQAQLAGFKQPITIPCSNAAEGRTAGAELGYPVIVKPARSFSERHATEHKPAVAADEGRLVAAAATLGGPFLVQELLGGAPVVSCAGVIADGHLLGFVTSRYARVWPPSRGSAAASETFEPPASLRERIHRLVAGLGWTGVFEIELLERPNGSPAVIDFNTRLYGTLALAVRAGCNLPAIWCRYLVQRDLVDASPATGVHYRWEDGELFSLMSALARGERRTATTIVRSPRDVVWAHYQPGDPGPLVARLFYLGRRGLETALAHASTGGQL